MVGRLSDCVKYPVSDWLHWGNERICSITVFLLEEPIDIVGGQFVWVEALSELAQVGCEGQDGHERDDRADGEWTVEQVFSHPAADQQLFGSAGPRVLYH